MKIPKILTIHGKNIPIKYISKPKKLNNKEMYQGLADLTAMVLTLSTKDINNKKFGKAKLDAVFLHEVVHFIFSECKKPELTYDEDLVDEVSNLMHQVINQIEG
jgi:hypothetical protein